VAAGLTGPLYYTTHGANGLDSSATVFTVAAAGSSAACRITIVSDW